MDVRKGGELGERAVSESVSGDILLSRNEKGFYVDPATGAEESDVLDEVVAVGAA